MDRSTKLSPKWEFSMVLLEGREGGGEGEGWGGVGASLHNHLLDRHYTTCGPNMAAHPGMNLMQYTPQYVRRANIVNVLTINVS